MKKVLLTLSLITIIITSAIAQPPEIQKLNNVINTLHNYYIKPLDNNKLIDNAIRGMIAQLDPHSSYLNEQELKELKNTTNGNFDGIGILVIPYHGALKVISPIDESPAQKAGIKAGDIIIRVNDKLIKDIPLQKAILLLRGSKGTKISLQILRKDQAKPINLTITRATIKVPNIKYKVLVKHYGYIRIAFFQRQSKKAILRTIKSLNKKTNGLQGLVIDLRNNPGGLLTAAIKVTDLFLDAKKLKHNKLIVYTQGYPNNKRQNYRASNEVIVPQIPIVVLINSGSASAAEIMAGALQDHKRAVILGTRSFGKGSVQSVLPINKKSALKLTTALYYTPKGREIQEQGIKPDVIVTDLKIPHSKTDTLLFDPIREINLQNHIKNGHHDNTVEKAQRKLMQEDFQLYEALHLLQGLSRQN